MSAAVLDTDFVLFGASGDLARRKLLPALYRLFRERGLNPASRIFAAVRNLGSVDAFIDAIGRSIREHLPADEWSERDWQAFSALLRPISLDIQGESGWRELAGRLAEKTDVPRIFYLSIPPALFAPCCAQLSRYGMTNARSRVVVEKPLGYDAVSAEAINNAIGEHFAERQIFRIDHYLGKESVQNLMTLRFANRVLETLWHGGQIDHVQITVAETVGLEGRAGFYDEAGAMRDMVQNHMLQLLALVAMEAPDSPDAEGVRREKLKVLRSLRPIRNGMTAQETVRGQYLAGQRQAMRLPSYREELTTMGGRTESDTETFVALRCHVDNPRWQGVPFYLRTGKRMPVRSADVVLQFRPATASLYDPKTLPANRLILRLQPEPVAALELFGNSSAGTGAALNVQPLRLDFSRIWQNFRSDAYKNLLLDVLADDASLLVHRDEVSAAWEFVDPIIDAWKQHEAPLYGYPAGSWGPGEAETLLQRDGRSWLNQPLEALPC